jgi:lysyl-tRNA synthetase class 2
VDKPQFFDNEESQWRPSCSADTLRQRADIIARIRRFFAERNVLEVETPCLSQYSVTDPHLHALNTLHTPPGSAHASRFFLQTSPEYAMKRLLAAGLGDIFQITKAFRDDEVGRHHNPEFTLLEWYRLGYSMQALIDESADMLMMVLGLEAVEQYTYQALFQEYCGFDPLTVSLTELVLFAEQHGLNDYVKSLTKNTQNALSQEQNDIVKDNLLQVLFNQEIESQIGQQCPTVVTHFPATQAALATLNDDGLTANRFEIYFKGIELANGFNELTDPKLQVTRFEDDNRVRRSLGLQAIEIDAHFISALQHGLPPCSGIALGIDRLIMLALGKKHISEVVSFSHDRC